MDNDKLELIKQTVSLGKEEVYLEKVGSITRLKAANKLFTVSEARQQELVDVGISDKKLLESIRFWGRINIRDKKFESYHYIGNIGTNTAPVLIRLVDFKVPRNAAQWAYSLQWDHNLDGNEVYEKDSIQRFIRDFSGLSRPLSQREKELFISDRWFYVPAEIQTWLKSEPEDKRISMLVDLYSFLKWGWSVDFSGLEQLCANQIRGSRNKSINHFGWRQVGVTK